MRICPGLLAATSAALLSACAGLAPMTEALVSAPATVRDESIGFIQALFAAPQKAIEAVEIGRAQQCNSQGRESVVNLFTDVSQLKAWEVTRGVQLMPVTGTLPPGSYVIAEMGERNTGGYALAISRQAAASNDTLYLKATYLHPSAAGMATQILTAPCSLVALRSTKSFSRAILLDQANKVRAVWTLATASAPLSEPPTPLTEPATQNPAEALHPEAPPAEPPAGNAPPMDKLPLPAATPSVSPTP